MADGELRERGEARRQTDQTRNKTRVNLGLAFSRWRAAKERMGLKSDEELACFFLDRYLRSKAERRADGSSAAEPRESVRQETPPVMRSPRDAERDARADSPENGNGKESGKKDSSSQRQISENERTTHQSENKENTDFLDEDEELSTSLSVGDGHYLVDLGSSSEFIVDEECILQLFKSCRECNRQCTVRKHVNGLKLVVNQACCFCQSRFKWTNLPDDDDSDLHINGKNAARGQANSAAPPRGNTS